VGGLLTDAAPDIRRAALLALRPGDAPPAAALADPDPGVATAAAVALCRRASAGGTPVAAPSRPLREVARGDDTPIEDAVELLPCLASSGDPADREALEQLRQAKSRALRDRAAELLDGR
jgi:hypothetical protein